jgi:hypothetical protein
LRGSVSNEFLSFIPKKTAGSTGGELIINLSLSWVKFGSVVTAEFVTARGQMHLLKWITGQIRFLMNRGKKGFSNKGK